MVHAIDTPFGGTLATWLLRPGDGLHEGDVVAVVETTPGRYELVEVHEDGVFDALLVQGGEPVRPGTPLATLSIRGD